MDNILLYTPIQHPIIGLIVPQNYINHVNIHSQFTTTISEAVVRNRKLAPPFLSLISLTSTYEGMNLMMFTLPSHRGVKENMEYEYDSSTSTEYIHVYTVHKRQSNVNLHHPKPNAKHGTTMHTYHVMKREDMTSCTCTCTSEPPLLGIRQFPSSHSNSG